MSDEAPGGNGRTPQTVREVGFMVESLRNDIARMDHKLDAYVVSHRESHAQLEADVHANTEWRKERQVYERLTRWLIGSNAIAIVVAGLAIVTFLNAGPS